MGRDVHSLTLSIQHFLCRPRRRPPSEVPWGTVLERMLWRVTCPNRTDCCLLTVAWGGSCEPTVPVLSSFVELWIGRASQLQCHGPGKDMLLLQMVVVDHYKSMIYLPFTTLTCTRRFRTKWRREGQGHRAMADRTVLFRIVQTPSHTALPLVWRTSVNTGR